MKPKPRSRAEALVKKSTNEKGLLVTSSFSAAAITTPRGGRRISSAPKKKASEKPCSQERPPSGLTISESFRSVLDQNAAIIQRWFRGITTKRRTQREGVTALLQNHKAKRFKAATTLNSKKATPKIRPCVGSIEEVDPAVRKRREEKAKAARNVR